MYYTDSEIEKQRKIGEFDKVMKIQKKLFLCALAEAAVFTALMGSRLFLLPEMTLSDRFYQKSHAPEERVILVGLDDAALEAFGPYSGWDRSIITSVIRNLNQSEDCRPAVIGIDMIFSGMSTPELDEALVEAAGEYDNVIVASIAEFGSELAVREDGSYYLDTEAVRLFEEPFAALRAVTGQGHINAMYDVDGVLRHHMLELAVPDGRVVPSMALAVADYYRSVMGEEPVKRPPVNGKSMWYLPFCGTPGMLSEGISLADVAEGTIPAEFFADAIVLIGPYTMGLQDSCITAISHAEPMYGVEVHANAVLALLEGNFKREIGRTPQLVLLFFILLVIGMAFLCLPLTAGGLLCGAAAAGYLGLCRVLYRQGILLQVLWIPAGILSLYLVSVGIQAAKNARERLRLTRIFRQYVSPEVVDEIVKKGADQLELGGKLEDIAVMFVDIRDFTPLSENLTAPQVVDVVNMYLRKVTECIFETGGTIDKYEGDAVMAFWGAPIRHEDYVYDAARAAVLMVQRMEELQQEYNEKYGQIYPRKLMFGIGIHVGQAVVGNIGTDRRMDYTAIGDVVNMAARLQGEAKQGRTIVISEEMAERLNGRIRTASHGWKELKGKKNAVELLTLEEIL